MKICICHFFCVTSPNFLKRLALKASFQQISFAKKFEAKKNTIFIKISTVFYCNFTGFAPSIAYNGMAAWRSGGISALPFKSALPPPLRQTARCTLAFYFLFQVVSFS
jgi:hypothetical protein